MIRLCSLALACVVSLSTLPPLARADGKPDFSYQTLNGITHMSVLADGIPPDLVAYGFKPEMLESRAKPLLSAAGITVVPPEEALITKGAGQLRLRFTANQDPHGFYYFGLRLELRQKIPLGNPAGGFVSQIVWRDGESGTMQYNEADKVLTTLDHLLQQMLADYREQNPIAKE